jgi:hypothetical protein
MQPLNLKPSHKLVKSYYETLGNYGQLSIDHEMAVRSAFQNLLAGCGMTIWTRKSAPSSPKVIPPRTSSSKHPSVRCFTSTVSGRGPTKTFAIPKTLSSC